MTKKTFDDSYVSHHFLLEVRNVQSDKLKSKKKIEERCVLIVKDEKPKKLDVETVKFGFSGVSCTATTEDMRICCTTCPEKASATINIYTCGEKNNRGLAFCFLDYFDSDDFTMDDYIGSA
tara:strand:+ start:86 stop:448 length:363 start_codon:yes stop_codon:yes gene_type:complete